MLEPTKKPHTEDATVVFSVVGPANRKDEAVRELKRLGFTPSEEEASWRVLPVMQGREAYSVVLRGARHKEGLTQKQLAQAVGIPQSHISQMENGRMAIGKERAKRLGATLNMDYRVFL